jgi:RNA polymerase sigma-70 factor (ECF subfamily)
MSGRRAAHGPALHSRTRAGGDPPQRRAAAVPRSDELERRIEGHLGRGEIDEAATAAIQGYGPPVLGFLCMLLPEDDARDVFSTFAENVWRGLASFRGECTVRAWSYRLAWHAASRYRRDPYRRRKERLPTTAASRLAASMTLQASALGSLRRHERLGKIREQLDPEERTLLALRIDKELDWGEIATVLSAEGLPVSAVTLRKRFARLKQKLERLARREGFLD